MVKRIRARGLALSLSFALAALRRRAGRRGQRADAAAHGPRHLCDLDRRAPGPQRSRCPAARPPRRAILTDVALRHVAHLSQGGTRVKVRFSNLFGTAPVTFDTRGSRRAPAISSPTP